MIIIPVHPSATTATAIRLIVYEVLGPKIPHQISHVATNRSVKKDIT